MSQLSHEELEGRLNAQRKALALLFALVARLDRDPERVWALLEARMPFQDSQEDPGAVPTPAFAIEGAMMREYRLILEDAKARYAEARDEAPRPG